MSRRILIIVAAGRPVGLITTACTNKKVTNPIANVDSKQPDKVLFDRAMDAMKHNRFDVARLTMQTLINTYPDSEFIARAKLAVADSWYAEGGSAAMAQAEIEYKDFITFFPNMPEAAEAQLKIANIHLSGDGKARPRLHPRHAGRGRIPAADHAVPRQQAGSRGETAAAGSAGGHCRARVSASGVSTICASRIPRPSRVLQSLVDKYPLYSKADEALVPARAIV